MNWFWSVIAVGAIICVEGLLLDAVGVRIRPVGFWNWRGWAETTIQCVAWFAVSHLLGSR